MGKHYRQSVAVVGPSGKCAPFHNFNPFGTEFNLLDEEEPLFVNRAGEISASSQDDCFPEVNLGVFGKKKDLSAILKEKPVTLSLIPKLAVAALPKREFIAMEIQKKFDVVPCKAGRKFFSRL
jgi:hypothetical protein